MTKIENFCLAFLDTVVAFAAILFVCCVFVGVIGHCVEYKVTEHVFSYSSKNKIMNDSTSEKEIIHIGTKDWQCVSIAKDSKELILNLHTDSVSIELGGKGAFLELNLSIHEFDQLASKITKARVILNKKITRNFEGY